MAQAGKGSASSALNVVSQRRSQRSASRGGLSILTNGDVLSGRYRIIQPIGGGGVGAVYRTHDQDIDVDVALKTIAPKLLQTAEEKKNFSRKIRLARKLHHANIVRIYDDGYDGEQRFFTMQLLEGLTLRKVIDLRREKHQPFVSQEIEPIFRQLVAALEYAHRSTYHGDLKPDNIIILPDLLKLTDFCLIQALPLKPFLAIQKSRGRAFGYIAPEIKLEAANIDGRADIFSLGVILLEMLTGEVFSGRWDRESKKLCEALPKKADALIRRALSDHAEARFQAVDDFMDSLEGVLADGDFNEIPTAVGPPPPPLPTDDAELSDPELISGSSVMLIDGDTDPGATASHRLGSGGDHTPLERPPALRLGDDEPLLGPPPLPPEDDDVDTSIERRDPSSPSSLAEEVRRVTGDTSDVYHRRTEIESEHHALPSSTSTGGNGAGGAALPSPPPLPADAADSFSLDDETASEISEPLGIHDELTALSSFPEPPPGSRVGPLSTPMPTVLPPPLAPVLPPRRRKSKTPLFVGGALAFVLLLGAGLWLNAYIGRLKNQINEQRVSQFTTPAVPAGAVVGASLDAGGGVDTAQAGGTTPDAGRVLATREVDASAGTDPVAVAAAAAAEKKRLEEEQRRQQQEKQEAERRAEEQRRQQEQARQAALERQRVEQEQAAALMREQADRAAAENRVRERERKAEARRLAEQERKRQREEARKMAEEARQRKQQQRKRAAEEKARADAERKAREKAQREAKVAAAGPDSAGKCPRGMARVEASSFKMGSAPNDPMRNFEEKRLSKVDVATYCIDYYEYPNGKRVLPRTSVSWYQAKSLCEAKGKRLCTEEEWEKACKGPKSLRYPYGNRFKQGVCNTEDEQGEDRELALPKNFARCRSAYGPINLSGNAAEWTASKFSAGLSDRVHKGGAANRPDWAARCANRGNLSPNEKNPMLGFRCCADPL